MWGELSGSTSCLLFDCLDDCTSFSHPLYFSLWRTLSSICYFYLYYTVFFSPSHSNHPLYNQQMAPSHRCCRALIKHFVFSCTAPDKQHEKQHSHQSQRQRPLCCTGIQLCVRPSVCPLHLRENSECVGVCVKERRGRVCVQDV